MVVVFENGIPHVMHRDSVPTVEQPGQLVHRRLYEPGHVVRRPVGELIRPPNTHTTLYVAFANWKPAEDVQTYTEGGPATSLFAAIPRRERIE